jgi:hypothetical protein
MLYLPIQAALLGLGRLLASIGYQLCPDVRVVLDNGRDAGAFRHSTMSKLRVGSISENFR